MLHGTTARQRLRAITAVAALYALVLQLVAAGLVPVPAVATGILCHPGSAAQEPAAPGRPEAHSACCLVHHAPAGCGAPPSAPAIPVPHRTATDAAWRQPTWDSIRTRPGSTGQPRGPPLA